MPLVRLDVPDHLPPPIVRALADAVHEALVATAKVPPDDRFQVVTRHAAEHLLIDPGFLGVARGPGAVVVQVFLRGGRTDEVKRALYRSIVEGAAARGGVRPEDVMVVLTENQSPDWSFGGGVAHYAPG